MVVLDSHAFDSGTDIHITVTRGQGVAGVKADGRVITAGAEKESGITKRAVAGTTSVAIERETTERVIRVTSDMISIGATAPKALLLKPNVF
jgi:hypothetical protein